MANRHRPYALQCCEWLQMTSHLAQQELVVRALLPYQKTIQPSYVRLTGHHGSGNSCDSSFVQLPVTSPVLVTGMAIHGDPCGMSPAMVVPWWPTNSHHFPQWDDHDQWAVFFSQRWRATTAQQGAAAPLRRLWVTTINHGGG